MTGGYYFWLGASAEADPATRALHEAASASSRKCGNCGGYGIVLNDQRWWALCLVCEGRIPV